MDDKKDNPFAGIVSVWQVVSALVPAVLSFAVALYGYFVGQESIRSLIVVGICGISAILVMGYGLSIAVKVRSAMKDVQLKEEQILANHVRENVQAEARLKFEKAKAFDYKMYASLESGSVSKLFQNYGWDINSLYDKIVLQIDAQNEKYIKLDDLLSCNSSFGRDFQCLPVRNDEKWDKCMIQVSFIPIDKNNNIPLILRMPEAHLQTLSLHSREAKFTFVSFSPVPVRYEKKFDLKTCYQREVPNRISDSEFSFREIGCTMKYEKKDGKQRIYLFYMVAVHYPTISFVDENGALNMKVIRQLFAVNPDMPEEELKYFRKDHDTIIAAAGPRDIYNALSADGNKAVLSEHLKALFANPDYVVRSMQRDLDTNTDMIFEDHFNLLKGKLGEVELAYIQRMRS